MISNAEIIKIPYSGQYKEKIYDISSPWNSSNWTWVKFLNEDLTEWCGEFRGSPLAVVISKKHNDVLVLTSDYLYQLDCLSEELTDYESHHQYRDLAVTPLGDIILADYHHIEVKGSTLEDMKLLESPIEMDMIKFHGWSNNKLLITCDELLNYDNHVELELDGVTLEINIKEII